LYGRNNANYFALKIYRKYSKMEPAYVYTITSVYIVTKSMVSWFEHSRMLKKVLVRKCNKKKLSYVIVQFYF